MNLYTQMYERITELVSLLSDYEFEPTIRKISEHTGTSLSRTREDVFQLYKCGIPVYPEEIISRLDKNSSRYDDEILGIDLDLFPGSILLFLDKAERDIFLKNSLKDIMIKDSVSSASQEVKQRAAQVEKAIERSCMIRFRYRSPSFEGSITVETAPQMLFHNTTEGLYYIIAFSDENRMYMYRLDRILHDIRILPDQHFTKISDDRLDKMKYVWGADFNNTDAPVHVILRIRAETANILHKIRADTRRREYGTLRKEDDYYIYEDEVIGLNSLRSWILSFGSSIQVIEPLSLAEEIKDSARQRLLNYEDGNRFHENQ